MKLLRKSFKKTISLLLSFVMVFSLFQIVPFEAAAAQAATWSELQSEINGSDSVTVTLTGDITAKDSDNCLMIVSGKNITIDLNGYTLSRGKISADDNGSVISVKSGGSLTVKDSSSDSTGIITGGYSKNGGAICSEGALTIESGKITGNIASEGGGAIFNKGSLTISGGCIENNAAKSGGGVFNDTQGSVILRGSAQVIANKTTEYGGGGITNYGTLSVSENADINSNYGYTNGGGIWNGGTATVTGGSIKKNSATKSGSGICNTGILNMQGTPVVIDNMGDDVYLSAGDPITVTGRLESGTFIGVSSSFEKAVVTSGYSTYNSADPKNFFYENGDDCVPVIESDGEVKLNTEGIAYVARKWDDENTSVIKSIKHITEYTPASGSLSGLNGNKWYVVKGNVTVNSRVDNNGTANILLCDGSSINFKKGIRNQSNMNSELNIYAQLSGTGKLIASGEYDISPIGPQDEAKNGTTNIYGGVIEAGYGIGSAYKCAGGKIRIYGAEVKCNAIGCGTKSPTDSSVYIGVFNSTIKSALHSGAGTLDFYNSTLDTYGLLNMSSADIGGYDGCKKMGNINIVNSYIDADTKVGRGAAIGSCEDCDNGNIHIIGSTVNAQCVDDNIYGLGYGAAIGGGQGGRGGNIVIEKSCVVAAAFSGAAIGGGKGCSGDSITINNSVVMTSALQGGAGIGGGDDGHGGNITINNSYVYSKTESNSDIPDPIYASAGVSIMFEMMRKMTNGLEGGGSQVAYYHAGYMVAYFLAILFAPTHGGAAIGGGDSGDSGTINITGSEITAIGGEYTAGIGGGDEGGCNNITIRNSNVTATGGAYGAGIGSGDEAEKMETIKIIESTVTASSVKEGAGIGGGNDTSNHEIIITDSTVNATGGKFASGIGGGDDGSGGTITISGSTVTATGGKDAAGIGGGEDGDGGTVTIYSSTVTATGNHYGAGIGCGEDGDSATISIYSGSTVEATSGDSGYAAAIGSGDYVFSSPDVSTYLGDSLAVKAGSSSSDTQRYTGKDRYNAVWESKYAKIYPCEHPDPVWRYDNSSFHRQYCKDCGTMFGEVQSHIWNSENVCTVCGGSATMVTLKLIEKNSAGEDVITEVQVPKHTEYTLPQCTNAPDGMEFVCWNDDGSQFDFYEPGDVYYTTGNTLRAVYLPLVNTQFIDSEGNSQTVQARLLTADVNYLCAGWYVANSNIEYPRHERASLRISGNVRLILADGVTVTIDNDVSRAIEARNSLTDFSIYGQTAQSGVLKCENGPLSLASLKLYGGSLISNGSVSSPIGANFMRGNLSVKTIAAVSNFVIGGGTFYTNMIYTNTDVKLGWTALSDSIRMDDINTLMKGTFTVSEGQAFTDGVNVYTGTLTADQVNEIKGKTLRPYQLHHFGDPEWTWSDDYEHAAALFRCTDEGCNYATEVDAVVTSEETTDRIVYTATAEINGTTYTDTATDFPDGVGERLAGHSISLSGDIAVNFYMELSHSVIAHKNTAYMHFTIPIGGGTTEQDMPVKDAVIKECDDKTYYIFKCRVAAKEMTSQIKAQIIDGNKSGTEYTYSVKEYADYLLEHTAENPEYEKAAPLVRKMLNYGAFAQIYFDKNPTDLANANLPAEDKELGSVTITPPQISADLPEGVTFEGATLSLKSETTLSIYLKSDTEPDFDCEGYTVEKAASGGYQIARIRGIPAKKLKNSFTLTVSAGGAGGSVVYSPMNYCYNVLNGGTDNEDLINAVKALVLYAQAADAYFPD